MRRGAVLCALLFWAHAGPATAAKPPERAAFLSGLVLWSQATEDTQVRIAAVVRAGRVSEPADRPGLSAAMFDGLGSGGTRSLSARDVALTLEQLEATLSIESAADRSILSLSVAPQHFRPAVRLFADLLTNPAFEQADGSASPSLPSPPPSGGRSDVVAELVRIALELDDPVAAPATPLHFERRELAAYHQLTVSPRNMVIVLDGALDGIDAAREVGAAFLGWSAAAGRIEAPQPLAGGPLLSAVLREVSPGRASLFAGFAVLPADHPDRPALALAGFAAVAGAEAELNLIGGRVTGLHYLQHVVASDVVLIEAEVPSEYAASGAELLERAFRQLREAVPAEHDLSLARVRARTAFLSPPTTAGAAWEQALFELAGGEGAAAKFLASLDGVYAEALVRAARTYIE